MSDQTRANPKIPFDSHLKFYLAGKISKNDWRHDLVDGLRDAYYPWDANWKNGWAVLPQSILGKHDYIGPFFLACDHGCFHGPAEHGVGAFSGGERAHEDAFPNVTKPLDRFLTQRWITRLCELSIVQCDVMFVWLDSLDAFGTLVEIGMARSRGKRIWIGVDEKLGVFTRSFVHDYLQINNPHQDVLPLDELWFALMCGWEVVHAGSAREAFSRLLELGMESAPDLRTMPYAEYLKTEHWKQVRQDALERADHHCQLCNSTTYLNVHHNTYDRRGCEEPRDLVVLCRSCHAKFHNKLGQNGRGK